MEQKIVLSVVTVTYKPNVEELKLFINSFYRYNDLGADARLIIVDNSPTGSWDTSAIITEYPDVVFIPNPSNPGFGASNNIGFEYYQSEYVLFINNDVELLEPIFKKIIEELEKDHTIGCIGIHQEGGAPSFFQKMTCSKGVSTTTFNDKFHFISGAFMFFRSVAFREVGMFDVNIFMYLEEFDLSERLIAAGYHTEYFPNFTFLHKVGNRKKVNDKIWIRSIPSVFYVYDKYGIDPSKQIKGLCTRLHKLIIYNLITFDFSQVKKCFCIYQAERQYLKQYQKGKRFMIKNED